jgi:hypothetical protein
MYQATSIMPLTLFHVTQLGTLKNLFLSDDIAAIKNDTISLLPATSFLSGIHTSDSESDVTDMENSIIISAVSSLDSLAVRSMAWDRVRTATASDNSMNELINFIESGIPEFRYEFSPTTTGIFPIP